MKKISIFAALAVCAFVGRADNWGDAQGWVYTPKYSDFNFNSETVWEVTDSRGNIATLVYDSNTGYIDPVSLNNALESLKLSVASVFKNMADLGQAIVVMNRTLALIDKELSDLDTMLDNVFAAVFGKMKELEEQCQSPTDSGGSKPSTVIKTIVEKTQERIVYAGGVKALYVDGKTIGVKNEGKANACYQLKNYPDGNGFIPTATDGKGLIWDIPAYWFDGLSLDVDVGEYNTPIVDDFHHKHGVHLSGWYYHESPCDEKLADRLVDGVESHWILTQKRGGRDSGKLHYMQIGQLQSIGGGGYAIKFTGTSAANSVIIGAPSSKTNQVTFASASDSNVAVTVGGNNDAVTITIGVYFK